MASKIFVAGLNHDGAAGPNGRLRSPWFVKMRLSKHADLGPDSLHEATANVCLNFGHFLC